MLYCNYYLVKLHKGIIMEKELLGILNTIKNKTNIDVAVVSQNGLIEANTYGEYVKVPLVTFNEQKEPVVVNEENKTCFYFSFNDTDFIGAIEGTGATELNYAVFISSFIENSQVKNLELSFGEQYLSIILGDFTKSRTLHFQEKYSVPKKPCSCILFKVVKGTASDFVSFLNEYVLGGDTAVKIDDEFVCLVKFNEYDLESGGTSNIEYSEYIVKSVFEELGYEVVAYVGSTVNNFIDISISYKQAVETLKMSGLFNIQNSVNAYKHFLILKMAEDLPSSKIQEFLTMLLEPSATQILSDEEIITTAEAFLNYDLNVSETARALYVHRNTLIYRIDKIKKITGLDIRKFNDALAFKIISVLAKIK